MRGKATRCEYRYASKGITPAYAGKSRALYVEAKNYEDHPRLCGEKGRVAAGVVAVSGSPPPMRGKGYSDDFCDICLRITPAYAGKSVYGCRPMLFPQDHPRLCGEKRPTERSAATISGSPPPMRGKDCYTPPLVYDAGITPAYAGKRAHAYLMRDGMQDHPRLCGEKTISRNFSRFSSGSPPPMRGKAEPMQIVTDLIRITPAYAGKSFRSMLCRPP